MHCKGKGCAPGRRGVPSTARARWCRHMAGLRVGTVCLHRACGVGRGRCQAHCRGKGCAPGRRGVPSTARARWCRHMARLRVGTVCLHRACGVGWGRRWACRRELRARLSRCRGRNRAGPSRCRGRNCAGPSRCAGCSGSARWSCRQGSRCAAGARGRVRCQRSAPVQGRCRAQPLRPPRSAALCGPVRVRSSVREAGTCAKSSRCETFFGILICACHALE